MNITRIVSFAILSAALAASSLAALAQKGSMRDFGAHHPPMEKAFKADGMQGRWWNNPKVIEDLKLTDEQRKAFDTILDQYREKLIDLRANVEKAEIVLAPLMGEDQPNEAKILAQIDKVAQTRAELEKANARFLLGLRAKLTPAQWKQMQAFRQSHGAGPMAPPPPPQAPPAPMGKHRN